MSCGKSILMETNATRKARTGKFVAVVMVVSLVFICVLSLVGSENKEDLGRSTEVMNDENLQVVAAIASATTDLSSAHLSFTTYVQEFNQPTASEYYNNMIDSQISFAQFLRSYDRCYSFASLPHMGKILADEDRSDLLMNEQSAFSAILNEWYDYTDDVAFAILSLNQNQTQIAGESMLNATKHVEALNDGIISITGYRMQASELMMGLANSATHRATELTTIAAASLVFAAAIALVVYVVESKLARKRP